MATPEPLPFVRRDAELERLDRHLELAMGSRGQVAFVTGEPGAGKTALLSAFGRRAEAADRELLYAYADCDARTGAGDPYLPFREILALLAGETEAELAQGNITPETASRWKRFLDVSGEMVFEAGTEVLGAFLPGAGLAAKLAAKLGGRGKRPVGRPGLGPAQIQEQYTRIVRAASDRQPLIVVVDDLQWADRASLDLFFHLARRLEGSRVLILGAYRPNDVALGRDGRRHPLEAVVAELRRYGGDIVIDLDTGGEADRRSFVEALLETRPNRFDATFVDRLVEHTGGHALFVVEVLSALEERGRIARGEDGVWFQTGEIEWARIPAGVEGVIEERVGRLDRELRDALTVASVEGDEFHAEVVARVESSSVRSLVRRLSKEADGVHRLVTAGGVRRIGAARLSGYRFRHALFQRYLYARIDAVERSHLHQGVGEALEELLGDASEELAAGLAAHFLEAGDDDRAIGYLLAAGKQALRLSAYTEAHAHYLRGLELVGRARPGPERDRRRLSLLAAAGVPLLALRGYADPDVQALFAEAQELVGTVGEDHDLLSILFGLLTYNLARGNLAAARAIADRRLEIARGHGAPEPLREALVSLAFVRFYMGELTGSTALIREAAGIMPGEHGAAAIELFDPAGSIHRGLALLSWLQGRPDEALAAAEEAIRVTRAAGSLYGQAAALGFAAVLATWCDDHAASARLAEECHALSEREGYAFWIAFAGIIHDWARACLDLADGRPEAANEMLDRMGATIERFAAAGTELWRPYFLALLADGMIRAGRRGSAVAALAAALETSARTGEVFWDAEILRHQAGCVAADDPARARERLERALDVASRQGAVAIEARVAAGLAAL